MSSTKDLPIPSLGVKLHVTATEHLWVKGPSTSTGSASRDASEPQLRNLNQLQLLLSFAWAVGSRVSA